MIRAIILDPRTARKEECVGMSTQWRARSVLFALIAVLTLSLLVSVAPAAAANTASVTVHARICPIGQLNDLFTDCHGNPMTDQAFRLGSRTSKLVNSRGNVTFNEVAPGSYVVALTSGDQPNEFLHLRAFCSDSNVGGPATEVLVRSTAQASFRVNVIAGQAIVCDVYYLPESGQ
jgi:hypothetical protein